MYYLKNFKKSLDRLHSRKTMTNKKEFQRKKGKKNWGGKLCKEVIAEKS